MNGVEITEEQAKEIEKQNQNKMQTFIQFLNNYVVFSDNKCRIKSDFFDKYPVESLPQAYEIYKNDVETTLKRIEKINLFEQFLQNNNYQKTNSNISESRYYHFNGIEYRFSKHAHPTGTMTSLNGALKVVDFFCNPELIDDIIF